MIDDKFDYEVLELPRANSSCYGNDHLVVEYEIFFSFPAYFFRDFSVAV